MSNSASHSSDRPTNRFRIGAWLIVVLVLIGLSFFSGRASMQHEAVRPIEVSQPKDAQDARVSVPESSRADNSAPSPDSTETIVETANRFKRHYPALFRFRNAEGKWGYMKRDGEVIVAPNYLYAWEFGDESIAVVRTDSGFAVTDRSGVERFQLPSGTTGVMPVSEGMVWFENSDGLWGFWNEFGEAVLKPCFDRASMFSEGLAAVNRGTTEDECGFEEGGTWGFVNTSGDVVIPFQYDHVYSYREGMWRTFRHGLARVSDESGGKIINRAGQIILDIGSKDLGYFNDGVAPLSEFDSATKQTTTYYVDLNGNTQFSIIGRGREFYDGMAKFSVRGTEPFEDRYGYIDRSGAIKIVPKFFVARKFNEGIAAVSITPEDSDDPKWGYIDKTGAFVIPPRFNDAGDFHRGTAKVHVGGVFWVTDNRGECDYWDEGEFWLIDRSGNKLASMLDGPSTWVD